MPQHIVSPDEWIKARKDLLEREKAFTRQRDRLTAEIRALPWHRVEKDYLFSGPDGTLRLIDLFEGRSQLAIYHFMFGPDWEQGCKSCSFWADGFQGIPVHLAHRDLAFVVVSRAPLSKLDQFKRRMGWAFPWVSSLESDFNVDFGVSFSDEDERTGQATYNYRVGPYLSDEMPGASFFCRRDDEVFHTYSTYGRGLDLLNSAYNWLDLACRGRDEHPDSTMDWVRHHDRYT